MEGIAAPWAAFIALATYQHTKANGLTSLPPPQLYAGSSLVFGLLALVAQSDAARTPAALAGWALVVAQFLRMNPVPGAVAKSPAGTLPTSGVPGGKANPINTGTPIKG